MGKFITRLIIGAGFGLLLMWVWRYFNQEEDDFDELNDDEVVEIPLVRKQADSGDGAVSPVTHREAVHADAAARAVNTAQTAATAPMTNGPAGEEHNFEWVDGIGPVFSRILKEAGYNSDADLANTSLERLQATGINRNDDEFADWIKQAKARVAGK